jgi:hypothetical protein
MIRLLPAIAAGLLCLGLASCSTTYNREWKTATASGSSVQIKDVSGPWKGIWRSEANGHSGELRCIISPQAGTPGAYRFHYHATFMGTLSATYDVTHLVKQTKNGFVFAGDQKLTGLGGGMYHYEGGGTLKEFRATYRSSSDHGVFEMKRP